VRNRNYSSVQNSEHYL